MTVAEAIIACLVNLGVDKVFGYPGASVLPLYDALYDRVKSGEITHILSSHEQDAAHAADGYARVSGKPGVVFATSGPGATNLITGMAAAYMDSSPVVFITANAASSQIGRDAFQEVDITGIALPVVKYSRFITEPDEALPALHGAFKAAMSGRKGTALIDIASDVLTKKTNAGMLRKTAFHPINLNFEEVINQLATGNRQPATILLGGGARGDAVSLAEKLQAPVAVTMPGLGRFPASHKLFAGLAGNDPFGEKFPANRLIRECGVLLAIGTRFSDRLTDAGIPSAKCKVIHVDIDRAELNKNVRADICVHCDSEIFIRALLPELEQRPERERVYEYDCPFPVPENLIVASDVGSHMVLAAREIPFERPDTFLGSFGFGAMGFGLGAAIGAKLAKPDAFVVHVTGDGSLRMNAREWATAARYGTPILTILINNSSLGLVKHWQEKNYRARYSETLLTDTPDFLKLAAAYGVAGERVRTREELYAAAAKAPRDRCYLIEYITK